MSRRFTKEERDRAVRLFREYRSQFDSKTQALRHVAAQVGCSGEAIRRWHVQALIDAGELEGVPSDVVEELRSLRKQNQELQQEMEILRAAATFFARECDPPRM